MGSSAPPRHSLPSDGIGKRIRRVKTKILGYSDKGRLIGKAKSSSNNAKQGTRTLLPIHRGVWPSPGKLGSITHSSYLERQMP